MRSTITLFSVFHESGLRSSLLSFYTSLIISLFCKCRPHSLVLNQAVALIRSAGGVLWPES